MADVSAQIEVGKQLVEQKAGIKPPDAVVKALEKTYAEKGATATLEFGTKPIAERSISEEQKKTAVEQNIEKDKVKKTLAEEQLRIQSEYIEKGYDSLALGDKTDIQKRVKGAVLQVNTTANIYNAISDPAEQRQFLESILRDPRNRQKVSELLKGRVIPDFVEQKMGTKAKDLNTQLSEVQTQIEEKDKNITAAQAKIDRIDTGLPAMGSRPAVPGELTRVSNEITVLDGAISTIDAHLAGGGMTAAQTIEIRNQRAQISQQKLEAESRLTKLVQERQEAEAGIKLLNKQKEQLDNTTPGKEGKKQQLDKELVKIQGSREKYEDEWLKTIGDVATDAASETIKNMMADSKEVWVQQKSEIQDAQIRSKLDGFDENYGLKTFKAKDMLSNVQSDGIESVIGAATPGGKYLLGNPEALKDFEAKFFARMLSLRIQEGSMSEKEFMEFANSRHVGREKLTAAITEHKAVQQALKEAKAAGVVSPSFLEQLRKLPDQKWFKILMILLGIAVIGGGASMMGLIKV